MFKTATRHPPSRRANDVEDDPHDWSAAEELVLIFVLAKLCEKEVSQAFDELRLRDSDGPTIWVTAQIEEYRG